MVAAPIHAQHVVPCRRSDFQPKTSGVSLPQSTKITFHLIFPQKIFTNTVGNVTNWQDISVFHKNFGNSSASTAPSNTVNGVFYGNNPDVQRFLQATNNTEQEAFNDGDAVLLICAQSATVDSGHPIFVSAGNIAGFLTRDFTDSGHFRIQNSGGSSALDTSAITRYTNDYILNGNRTFYTNGISAGTASALGSWSFDGLGGENGSGLCFPGYILEVVHWTNVTFNSSELAQIHQYQTNTWKGIQ